MAMDRRLFLASVASTNLRGQGSSEAPREWLEPTTGHRVVRLSDEGGSASLYFHQNPFVSDGNEMIYTVRGRLAVLDWKKRKSRMLTDRPVRGLVVAPKSGTVYFHEGGEAVQMKIATGERRVVAKLPREYAGGAGLTVNADETLLAGTSVDPEAGTAQTSGPTAAPNNPIDATQAQGNPPANRSQDQSLEAVWRRKTPRLIYTVNIKSGEVKVIRRGTDWFNHIQFSPTDPQRIMYCHEGPWHFVDRIWTIRTDGSEVRKMHSRTMDMEIAGHEFWAPDGKTVWFDLQTPKSKVFWLAGVELATGKTTRYEIPREQWSVHYNVSPDEKLFAGDGGGPRSVAAPGNGQWIYLFRPEGKGLRGERLVDLARHDYRLEPNVIFHPNGEWIVFRSNLYGVSHVYAVEVKKSSV